MKKRDTDHPSRSLAWLPLLVLSISCTTDAEQAGGAQPVASHDQPIQSAHVGGQSTQIVMGSAASSAQARSTAALRILGGPAPFASCGATFVSPHYAVTAAHCVKQQAFLFVEEFETSNLERASVFGPQSQISGSWASGFSNGGTLTSADGYNASLLGGCAVVRRCNDDYNEFECPFAADEEHPDIALIRCDSRTRGDYATTTPDYDAEGSAIEVWWFHEVYDLPTIDDGSEYWAHYGAYDEYNPQLNFHYTSGHQLIPLVTRGVYGPALVQFPGTPEYDFFPAQVLRHDGTESWGSLPICHGTSGSGVFLAGTNILLGPAVSGSEQVRDHLCHTATDWDSDGNSSHVSSAVTHAFVVGSPEIEADRL